MSDPMDDFLAEGDTSVSSVAPPVKPASVVHADPMDAFLNEPVAATAKPVKSISPPAQAKPPTIPVVPPVDTIAPNGIQSPIQPSPVGQLLTGPSPTQSIGQPVEPPVDNTPTMGPIVDDGNMKKADIIAQMQQTGGGGAVQREVERKAMGLAAAAAGGFMQSTLPYVLSGMDAATGKSPFDVSLHKWNGLFQQAQEDNPVATQGANMAGFALLPVGKLGLAGQVVVGASAAGLSTWLGSEMQATGSDIVDSAIEGGLMMGVLHTGGQMLGEGMKAGTKGEFGKLKDATRQYRESIKPILMTPESVVDLHDSLGAIQLPPANIEQAHAQSVIPQKLKATPKDRYELAMTLSKIANDPASVNTYKVSNLKDMNPVGPTAEIRANPDGTYTAVLHEVSGKGAGVYHETIETAGDAQRFRKELDEHHPDIGVFVEPNAQAQMIRDNETIFDALYKRPTKVAESNFVSSDPTKTGNQRPPKVLSPADEGPVGFPDPQPGLATVNDEGFLSIYHLDTPAAQAAGLVARDIAAITTPRGTRYVRRLFDADKGFTGVAPFEHEEGIPTIEGVSRVPSGQLRAVEPKELRCTIQRAKAFRRVTDKESIITGNEMNDPLSDARADLGGDFTPTKYNGTEGMQGTNINRQTGKAIGPTNFHAKWDPVDVHVDSPRGKLAFTNESRLDKAIKRMAEVQGGGSGNGSTYQSQNFREALGELNAAKKAVEMDKSYREDTNSMSLSPLDSGGKPPIPPSIVPESPPPSDPNQPPPPFERPTWDVIKAVSKNLTKPLSAFNRDFQPPALRADFDLGNVILDKIASQSMAKVQTSNQKAFERWTGWSQKRISAFREDAYEWANARIKDEVMEERHPKLWGKKMQIMKDWEITRDRQHQAIVELGGVDDSNTPSEEQGILLKKYVTRSFFTDTGTPGARLKLLLKDETAMAKATAGFQQWAKDNNSRLTVGEARARIIDALGTKDPESILFGGTENAKGQNIGDNLRGRKDLPPWYLEFRGENRDGFYAMSRTDAVQKSVILNLQAFKAIAENPEWAVHSMDEVTLPQDVKDSWKRLPDNQREFGKASGMWVNPEVYDTMVTMPNTVHHANGMAAAVIAIQKANWFSLGRMRTYMATFMDNWLWSALSGGIDLTRPVASLESMHFINKAMWEYRKNPFATSEHVQFIQDMRRMGGDDPGHIGSDLKSQARRQAQYFQEKMMSRSQFQKTYTDWFNDFADIAAATTKPGSAMFELSDRWHKLGSIKIISDDLMKKPTLLNGLYAQFHGATPPAGIANLELARRIAVRQVMEYFPMYGHASPAANFMSRGAQGIAAPTALFSMERNRVMGNLPMNLIKDNSLKFRMLKWAGVGAGLYGGNGLLRHSIGQVSDEDVAAAYQKQGLTQKMFSPGVWVLPVKVGGETQLMDFTQYLGPVQYLQGDPRLGPVARTVMNGVLSPFQQGMGGVALESMLNAGGVNTGPQQRPMLPGTNPLINMGQRFIDRGGIPAAIPEAYNNMANAGMFGSLNRKQVPMDTGMAVARTLGAPVLQPPSFQGKIAEGMAGITQMKGYLIMAAQMKPDQKVPLLQFVANQVTKLGGGVPESERNKIMQAAKQGIIEAAAELKKTGMMEAASKASHPRIIGGLKKDTKSPRRIGVDKP